MLVTAEADKRGNADDKLKVMDSVCKQLEMCALYFSIAPDFDNRFPLIDARMNRAFIELIRFAELGMSLFSKWGTDADRIWQSKKGREKKAEKRWREEVRARVKACPDMLLRPYAAAHELYIALEKVKQKPPKPNAIAKFLKKIRNEKAS